MIKIKSLILVDYFFAEYFLHFDFCPSSIMYYVLLIHSGIRRVHEFHQIDCH